MALGIRGRPRCNRGVMVRSSFFGLVVVAAAAAACSQVPLELPGSSTTSSATTSADGSSTAGPSATTPGSTAATAEATGVGTGSGSATGLDDTHGVEGSGSGSTAAVEDSGSSSDGTTGEPSPVGCADGAREALIDEVAFPDLAACAGGFGVPGVGAGTPACNRQGGDDGPQPDGMGCAIDDLCAEGWHLCASRHEVLAAGLASCDGMTWGGQFFATAQSGEGSNSCADTGTNDVFGCGDIGHTSIFECTPLNRSTGNLCVNLEGPWTCEGDAYDEVSSLVKPGSGSGGALCCRDGA